MDGHHVLRPGCPLILGLGLLCPPHCGKSHLILILFVPPLLTPSTSSRHSNRQEGGKEEEGKNDYDHVFRRIYPVEEITDGRERDGIISL